MSQQSPFGSGVLEGSWKAAHLIQVGDASATRQMNLQQEWEASRQKAVSFFHVLLCSCQEVWPRFRVGLLPLKNVIKKSPQGIAQPLRFQLTDCKCRSDWIPWINHIVVPGFQFQEEHFRSHYLSITGYVVSFE